MAQTLTCKICMLIFDVDGERQVPTEAGVDGPALKTLSFKLLSIGFFQDGAEGAEPCHLCSWCAARVEDAFELQQQCIKASQALKQDGTAASVKEPATVEALLEEVTNLDNGSLPGLTKSILPDLIRISKKGNNARTVSDVLTGAHDMFICVRKLSASLKLNASLLTDAVQFTENTLSFITVLLSMNEYSDAMKKSAETMRKEAKMWRTKSGMVSDATSFIECVSTSPVRPIKRQPRISRVPKEGAKDLQQEIETIELDTDDAEGLQQGEKDQDKNTEEKSQEESGKFQEAAEDVQDPGEDLQQSTKQLHESDKTVPSFLSSSISSDSWAATPPGMSDTSNIDDDALEDISESGSLEEQSVRRSSRSRSMVDTLVYWPKFKKQTTTTTSDKSSTAKPKSSNVPMTSPQALDCLLLRRDPDSESDTGSNEKWAIVKKRKSATEHGSKKLRQTSGTDSDLSAPSTDSTAVQNTDTVQAGVKRDLSKDEDFKNHINEKFHKTIKNKCSSNHAEASNNNNDSTTGKQEDSDGYSTDTKGSPVSQPTSPRSRTCKICGKVLKCNRNLQAHMNMHTGSSPYQCHFCHKLFTSSWNRIQHERVHTGMRPYKCDLCEESFRYNVSLRHHKSKFH